MSRSLARTGRARSPSGPPWTVKGLAIGMPWRPPRRGGQGLFNLTIIASDNVDGTGYVMEYPLTPDEDGVTIIDEEYNPSRFFRVRIDVQQ